MAAANRITHRNLSSSKLVLCHKAPKDPVTEYCVTTDKYISQFYRGGHLESELRGATARSRRGVLACV